MRIMVQQILVAYTPNSQYHFESFQAYRGYRQLISYFDLRRGVNGKIFVPHSLHDISLSLSQRESVVFSLSRLQLHERTLA